ncbi:MAG: response regulator [bacterium]|nr:response regulator [bacterium]
MANEIDLFFRGISDQDREAFVGLGRPVDFEADEVILPAGRSEWDLYIVQEGEVSLWFGNVHLADLTVGQTVGSSAILLPQIQRSAVRGNRGGVLLRIDRESIIRFFEVRPERTFQQFCVNLFKVWVEILKQRNNRIMDLQSQLLVVSSSSQDRRFKLLIVDDEPSILQTLSEVFEDRYDVVTAQDGLEAVTQAFSEKPDLILLDLRLPEIDGLRVCERLKGHPDTGHIPIVLVTALTATPDRVKGMMYGADEYLTKPVDIQQLDDTVNRILTKVYG